MKGQVSEKECEILTSIPKGYWGGRGGQGAVELSRRQQGTLQPWQISCPNSPQNTLPALVTIVRVASFTCSPYSPLS